MFILLLVVICELIVCMKLNNIPTIGHSGPLTSYITAMEWMSRGGELIQEGYEKASITLKLIFRVWGG